MDPYQSLKKLKKLGLEVDSHVLYEESCAPFFQWLSENITEENILTDQELRQYDELKKHKAVLSRTEINKRFEEINKVYPNIFSINDNQIKKCEEEHLELLKIEKLAEDLLSNLNNNLKKLSKELNDLENSKIELDFFYDKLKNECMQNAKHLQDIQLNNEQKLNELQQSFIKSHTPPLFIYQLPLEQYTDKCEQVHKYIDVYMHKNFKIKNNLNDDSNEVINGESSIKEIQEIKERLYAADNALIQRCIDVEGKKRLIMEMESGPWQPMSYENMKNETVEFDAKSNELLIYQDALLEELKTILYQLSEQKIDFILYEYNIKKLERAKIRMENVQTVSEIISNAALNADFIWILMQFDLERVNNIVNFIQSDQLTKDTYSCLKRTEALKGYLNSSLSSNICKLFTEKLGKTMAKIKDTTNYRKFSYEYCVSEYANIKKGIDIFLQNIIGKKFDGNFIQLQKNISDQNKTISKFIWDGPLAKPQLRDPVYLTQLFLAKQKDEHYKKTIEKLKFDYKKNIAEPMKSDRLYRFDQLLWVWFLTEPNKVLNAIKEVKTAAANQQSTAYKSISGIMCKK